MFIITGGLPDSTDLFCAEIALPHLLLLFGPFSEVIAENFVLRLTSITAVQNFTLSQSISTVKSKGIYIL